jgi:asparagine synthase (glutamine-hydrolysing)
MCGIFGQIIKKDGLNKDGLNKDKAFKAALKCQHRGPDNTSDIFFNYNDYELYLVFHRLSINGLTAESNQPLTIDNTTMICNGEIYNYKELSVEYNIVLKTDSDCEIIPHLYNLLGIDCIKLLDGVYTFILFDRQNGLLFVGHDPIGVRSGYMINTVNELTIASEMKSLLSYDGTITMIPPGTYIEYNLNTTICETIQYYHLDYRKTYITDDVCISMIKTKLYQAVKKRLMSDKPVGCLLSGGIDSSIICSIVNEIVPANEINTFSIGFKDAPDIIFAEKVASYLGTNHTTYIVSEAEMLDAIEPTIQQIESYDVTTVRASVPMYLLSKKIKENTDIRVILSGEGADELSGSYLYFHNAPSAPEFQTECLRLIKDVQHFDVLRGDKTTAGHGLEIRVPFFDKEFVKEYMSIDPELKIVRNGTEKYLLRKTFEDILPMDVVWRRKDGFSDGVSTNQRPWYTVIDEFCDKNFNICEQDYYKSIFDKYYGGKEYIVPYAWLPKWTDEVNPSGRLILGD